MLNGWVHDGGDCPLSACEKHSALGRRPQRVLAPVARVAAADDVPQPLERVDDIDHRRRVHSDPPTQRLLRHRAVTHDRGQRCVCLHRQPDLGQGGVRLAAGNEVGAGQHEADSACQCLWIAVHRHRHHNNH